MTKQDARALSWCLLIGLALVGCLNKSTSGPDGPLGHDAPVSPEADGGGPAVDGGAIPRSTGGAIVASGGAGGLMTVPGGTGGASSAHGGGTIAVGGAGGVSTVRGTGGFVPGGAGGGSVPRGTGGAATGGNGGVSMPHGTGGSGAGGSGGASIPRGTGGSLPPVGTGGTTAPRGTGGSLPPAGTGGATAPSGTGGTTTTGGAGGGVSPTLGGCRIFPPDNPWNTDVSAYPLHPNSATYIANMSPGTAFHPDWGTVTDGYGIPFSSGTGATPQPMTWTESWGAAESDPLPCPSGGGQFCYPVPRNAPIEGGTSADSDADRHVLYIDTAGAPNDCTLYELYNAQNPTGSSGWTAINGAIFHLGSNALRPDGWTSADAAGLPVLPGLVRYDEVMAGEIKHAIRFTVNRSSNGYIHPATHFAGNDNTSLPPMGLRVRLKASFDTSRFSGPTLVLMTAMKKYGLMLADNGSDWYITGESHEGWEPLMDDLLSGMGQLHGRDFEAVDTGPILTDES